MELREKVANLPAQPGVYLFQDASGKIVYVGKALSLRSRVRSYFLESSALNNAKTGSLVREIAELDYIVVDNEREALALENNLIKQYKPKFNILLRDDKTYPYIKYTAFEKFPRVYVTRRLDKDGSTYFGPYFPASLAYRLVHLIHKHFLVPSCTVDLSRLHPRPCLQYYIHRCLGPCAALVTDERYAEAARDVRLFLEGRRHDLSRSLKQRMEKASEEQRYEEAAGYRDLLRTLEEMEERQKIAAAEGDDTDVLAWYAEPPQVAVNLFHLRGGRVVDRRDFYWEDIDELRPEEFLPSLLKQLYLDAAYLPRYIHVPMDFEERPLLEEVLSETAKHKVEILNPQRGQKHAFLELVEKNAQHSFTQRFRVLKPSSKAIAEALQAALSLEEPPKRIECFDISHIQGSDTVASMVVWEDGRMKKSDYRKFIIRGDAMPEGPDKAAGILRDDFASMREAVERRYRRVRDENKPMPSLLLIDGGIGQLHAAAEALEKLEIINQPVASIAKKEEILYILGRENDPIVLDKHSPVLHLIQQIRDETHRFAVTFHRQRRSSRRLRTSLVEIPGVGERTAQKLLRRFGSVARLRELGIEELAAEIPRRQAQRVYDALRAPAEKTPVT